jgi:hypothetical protein
MCPKRGLKRIKLKNLPLSPDRLFLIVWQCVKALPKPDGCLEDVFHASAGGGSLSAWSMSTTRPELKSSRASKNDVGIGSAIKKKLAVFTEFSLISETWYFTSRTVSVGRSDKESALIDFQALLWWKN